MATSELRYKMRDPILSLAAEPGAGNVNFFGSVAREEESTDSDIDLLVDVVGQTIPWFPGRLSADLQNLLSRQVQVVIRRSLNPLIRDNVLKDERPL